MIASYYYDPFGRRLWKEVGGVRTYFHYSDEGLVGEYDSTGNEIKTYSYKPNSTFTTDPLFMKEGASYYFYHNDHLGTPQKMTAGNGAIVWSAKYSSFGEADVDASSTITNNLRFAGQLYDEETGLHYNYFRYYDSMTGRYLRTDPIGQTPSITFPQMLNYLYLFTENNPINKTDSTGLFLWLDVLKTVAECGLDYGHGIDIIAENGDRVWDECHYCKYSFERYENYNDEDKCKKCEFYDNYKFCWAATLDSVHHLPDNVKKRLSDEVGKKCANALIKHVTKYPKRYIKKRVVYQ